MDSQTKEPRFNYTGHGFEGKRYSDKFSTKDIALFIRNELKEKYHHCKFSVTKKSYTGGASITVALISAPFDVFEAVSESDSEQLRSRKEWNIKSGHTEVNHYYIRDAKDITEKAREVIEEVKNIANSYNFDDSDGMIDYFHTNFYLTIKIGKWNKPFIKV